MAKPFTIHFGYPLADTSIVFKLEALATLHHSDPYYVVNNFRVMGHGDAKYDVLPEVKIRRHQEEDGTPTWVHCDSGRPTELSLLLGRQIDEYSEMIAVN